MNIFIIAGNRKLSIEVLRFFIEVLRRASKSGSLMRPSGATLLLLPAGLRQIPFLIDLLASDEAKRGFQAVYNIQLQEYAEAA